MLPSVIGHRAAAAVAPENTLAGLAAARQAGATWVEVDVRFTRDGVPVLFHDDDLMRLAGRPGAIERLTAAEVRDLDVGCHRGPAFAGEGAPTLADALRRMIELDLGVVLEIKRAQGAVGRMPSLAGLVADLWPARRPRPVFSSFSWRVLGALARLPRPPSLALIAARPPAGWRPRARRHGLGGIHMAERAMTADLAARIKAAGLWLAVFTVNDPAAAKRLWSWGVDSVITDDPARLIASGS